MDLQELPLLGLDPCEKCTIVTLRLTVGPSCFLKRRSPNVGLVSDQGPMRRLLNIGDVHK